MLKRLSVALAALFAFVSLAQAAGTVPGFALTPQFDLTGKIAPGCKLFVYQAGTVATPQNSYQDSGLTIANPNPLTCDAAGRLPQWFVADGTIKLRLTTSTLTQIFVGDNLLVIGASSGGGGGSPVDPTTVLTTGDFKMVYGTGSLSGFVRCNGRTIGNASSGATERANADTSALFSFLWNNDANLTVSGGRGASAAADYAANKTIALPDCRGRALYGDDAMGNSAAGRLTSGYFGVASSLGAVGGNEKTSLTSAGQLPSHQHSVYLKDPGHVHGGAVTVGGTGVGSPGGSFVTGSTNTAPATTGITIGSINGVANDNMTAATGSGTAFATASPGIVITTYLKL